MKIKPFRTERYFAKYEFTEPHILSASDCESVTVDELLELAGADWSTLGELRLSYREGQGDPTLLERIAGMYDRVDASQVVGLGAPEEGIFITMHALLEPGDEVVVLSPCYDSLLNIVEYLGCQVARWFLAETGDPGDDGRSWCLDLGVLEDLVTPQTKMLIVNFPHNPTGCLPNREEWQAIVQIAARAGAWLFSDEMYRGLEHHPAHRLPSGCDSYDRAITLGGLSKTYGLPGLRTGWLALQDTACRDDLVGWKDYTTICASAPSEVLAILALEAGDQLARRGRAIVLDNLALAEHFFARRGDVFQWHRPQAGSVALVGLCQGSAEEFCRRLVAEQGVILLPSTGLGFGDGPVRFGFGRLSFPQALDQLDRYLGGVP
jgi:aspartate/methionine/tyrosine aminotransferase